MADRVLITGISGFLGGHVALQLLNAGYTVRGSLRHLSRADSVRQTLSRAGADTTRLDFVALDLLRDEGWHEATRDCRFVQHIASPLLTTIPADPMVLIAPAVEGTERALAAANSAGVERIVVTSSMAAIAYGHDRARTAPFTAAEWTDLSGRNINAYQQSKTLAERRAWAIMDAAGRQDALATINPGVILGPLLDSDSGTSAVLVQRLLNRTIPALPRTSIAAIDVRDVAAAHVAAMTSASAGGQRFPMSERPLWAAEMARIVRQAYPHYPVPRLQVPDWAARLYGAFNRDIGRGLGELGLVRQLDSSAAIALLGRALIPVPDAILATAQSLINHKLA